MTIAPDRPDYGDLGYGLGFYGGPILQEALIECSTGSTAPELLEGYETARRPRTEILDALDGSQIIRYAPAAPRSGTLHLFYKSESRAHAGMDLHARLEPFTLSHPKRSTIGMRYVVTGGNLALTLDAQTRDHWHLAVPYVEVV